MDYSSGSNCCCTNYHPYLNQKSGVPNIEPNHGVRGYYLPAGLEFSRLSRAPALYTYHCPNSTYRPTITDSTEYTHWIDIEDEDSLVHQFALGLDNGGVAYAWHFIYDDDGDAFVLADWSQSPDGLPGVAAVICAHKLTGAGEDFDGFHEPFAKQGLKGTAGDLSSWGALDDKNVVQQLSANHNDIRIYSLQHKFVGGQQTDGGSVLRWTRSGDDVTYIPWQNPEGGNLYLSSGFISRPYGAIATDVGNDGWDLESSLGPATDQGGGYYDAGCRDETSFGLRAYRSYPAPQCIALRNPGACVGVTVEKNGVTDVEYKYSPQNCVWHWDEAGVGYDYDFYRKITVVGGTVATMSDPDPNSNDLIAYVGGTVDELWSHTTTVPGRAYDTHWWGDEIKNGVTIYNYANDGSHFVAFTAIKNLGLATALTYPSPDTFTASGGGVSECRECTDDEGTVTVSGPQPAYYSHSRGTGDVVYELQIVSYVCGSEELLFDVTYDEVTGEVEWTQNPAASFHGSFGCEDGVPGVNSTATPTHLEGGNGTRELDPRIICPSIHALSGGGAAYVHWDQWKRVDAYPETPYDDNTKVSLETVRWKIRGIGASSIISERVPIRAETYPGGGTSTIGNPTGMWYGRLPFVGHSSDRWVYVYDFPVSDQTLGSRLSRQCTLEDIDYHNLEDSFVVDWATSLPDAVEPARSTDVFDESKAYSPWDRVWYPDFDDGSEYTAVATVYPGEWDSSDWTQIDGTGWVWCQWMISRDGNIWIPTGCRDDENRPSDVQWSFSGSGGSWSADALRRSRGGDEVPMIPPDRDHGKRRGEPQ